MYNNLLLIFIFVLILFIVVNNINTLKSKEHQTDIKTTSNTNTTASVTVIPTEAPTTEAPTTEAPTTEDPTTEAPTTTQVPYKKDEDSIKHPDYKKYSRFLKSFSENKFNTLPNYKNSYDCIFCPNQNNKYMCLENHEEKNIKDNYLLSDRMDVDEVLLE